MPWAVVRIGKYFCAQQADDLMILEMSFYCLMIHSKLDVFNVYKEQWKDFYIAVCQTSGKSVLESSKIVLFPYFGAIWNTDCTLIKIRKPSSDFFITRKNTIYTTTDDSVKESLQNTVDNHKQNANCEKIYYQACRSESLQASSTTLHVIVDFAEKVLLPSLKEQTGQLHFITGLKNDIFGVSCSNAEKNYIFSLAEGHWPGGKTANETCSMLLAAIQIVRKAMGSRTFRMCIIHCDNCAGQFKNRFFIWFCSWLQQSGLFGKFS